ncbi:hypothetical protein FF38_03099 [Lucilia cuprina]|uniref:TIL domain-containing protein n=1 Tax=Lucilia cuprina TaxID=7375 RepID=A0A0L0CJV0_LUCCU|nr:hypothetical protein CVS40_3212 [Lucilia cuprina]KNC32526.1 hypothetical protein FF38_03099 [Lucilia cuprina]
MLTIFKIFIISLLYHYILAEEICLPHQHLASIREPCEHMCLINDDDKPIRKCYHADMRKCICTTGLCRDAEGQCVKQE